MANLMKDGYEILDDTTDADGNKKARRRMGLMVASADQILRAGYNSQGADTDRQPGVPCYDDTVG